MNQITVVTRYVLAISDVVSLRHLMKKGLFKNRPV